MHQAGPARLVTTSPLTLASMIRGTSSPIATACGEHGREWQSQLSLCPHEITFRPKEYTALARPTDGR
jgi:hypothetical protein